VNLAFYKEGLANMFFEKWLCSKKSFSQLLSLLAREGGEDLSQEAKEVMPFLIQDRQLNPWYEGRFDGVRYKPIPVELTELSLFLTFLYRVSIDESSRPGQDSSDALAALLVLAEDVWPIYEVWVLGKQPRSKKVSHQFAMDWLSSPSLRAALAELGLLASADLLQGYVEQSKDKERSTFSIWHTKGIGRFYDLVQKETINDSQKMLQISQKVPLKISEINQEIFQRALRELFPAYSSGFLDLCCVREADDKESYSLLKWITVEADPTPHYQMIGPPGCGKTNLLLTAWKYLAYNYSSIVVGLTPKLAQRYNSLDELIGYWAGDIKIESQKIIVLCDDFDRLSTSEQEIWLLEIGLTRGWVITGSKTCGLQPSQILKICDVTSDKLYTYAYNHTSIKTVERILSLRASPVLAPYLCRLESAACFVDLYKAHGYTPTLLHVASQIIDTRLKRTGEKEIVCIAARKMMSIILNAIGNDESPMYFTSVQKVIKSASDLALLAVLLRAGLVSVNENRITIEQKLIFDYFVYHERYYDGHLIREQTRTQRLYWEALSRFEKGDMKQAAELLFTNTSYLTGFQSNQWHQLAIVLASLPKQYSKIEEGSLVSYTYLSIRNLFPSALYWSSKDYFLRLLPSPDASVSLNQIRYYLKGLEELKVSSQ
jgi:hypothetical protein